MSDEELLKSIEALLKIGGGATEQQIEENAYEFIRSQKQHLPNKFLQYNNTEKKAIFMAGGSGAGKSETAINIAESEKIDIIDTDNIRKICPLYSGKNAHLFQKASSRGVSILMNHVFKNDLSFNELRKEGIRLKWFLYIETKILPRPTQNKGSALRVGLCLTMCLKPNIENLLQQQRKFWMNMRPLILGLLI